MIRPTPQVERFKQCLRESLRRETFNDCTVKAAKDAHVYTYGDQDEAIYFIDSGQIKLLMRLPQGTECLLAIHNAGDVFGEFCLSGLGARREAAIALEETTLKLIPGSKFLMRLSRDSLLEGFVQYLAARIAERQQIIANLMMVDSEQRLGKTLLLLNRGLA